MSSEPNPLDTSTRWLRDWHDANAGATTRAFADGQDIDGRSSYQRLAALARPSDRVLDLACGDGHLLSLLETRGVSRGVGVDISEGELAAARERLGDEAELVCADARLLPFEDDSFDLVLCHMAFMLMSDARAVVAELSRVLVAGGRFEAIVSGPSHPRGAWLELLLMLRERDLIALPPLGDPMVWSADGLSQLFDGWGLSVRDFAYELRGSLEDLWRYFASSYDARRLTTEDLEALRVEFLERAAKHADEQGQVVWYTGKRHVRAGKL